MNIALIIPAYNEEKTIQQVIFDFHQALPVMEIFVIDNNSSDQTSQLALEAIKSSGCNGSVLFEGRQGKANALRKAFQEIDADYYVLVDADQTYSAQEVKNLLQPVQENKCDMTVGDRLSGNVYSQQNKRAFHDFGNQLVRNLINIIFQARLNDIMSGYRVFNRKFVKNFPIQSEGFEIETEMTLHALDKRFRIVEIPTPYYERPIGSVSKLNTFRDGFRVLKTIFSIFKDYRPFLFFGLIALLFAVAGLIIGIPVIYEYVEQQYVYKVPSAILSTGLMLFAMLLSSVGLILDTVVKQYKTDYEWRLNQYRDKP